jgi:hypothetical protein
MMTKSERFEFLVSYDSYESQLTPEVLSAMFCVTGVFTEMAQMYFVARYFQILP